MYNYAQVVSKTMNQNISPNVKSRFTEACATGGPPIKGFRKPRIK